MDKEVDTAGVTIPSKHQAKQPKAPPTVITTRVKLCAFFLFLSFYYLVEQKCVSDPLHNSLDKTLIYDT